MEYMESHRQRLTVSADDFGISSRANRNILYLIELGKINRVGIIANGEISQKEAAQLARSGVKLDIHLDILHEHGNNRKKRNAILPRILGFLGKFLTGKISQRKVRQDWKNQIEKFREIFGKNPDGLNSHEHVHLFPVFLKIAMDLRDEYSIPFLRFGDSVFMQNHNFISHIMHYIRKFDMWAVCSNRSCISTGSLVSLDWIPDIEKFLDNPPEGTTEIVCHPELADDFAKIKKYF